MSKFPLNREGRRAIDRDTPEQFIAFLLFAGAFGMTIWVDPVLSNPVELILWHLAQGTLGFLAGKMGFALTQDLRDPSPRDLRVTEIDDVILALNAKGDLEVIRKNQACQMPDPDGPDAEVRQWKPTSPRCKEPTHEWSLDSVPLQFTGQVLPWPSGRKGDGVEREDY
jgi:hypothetical protein